MQPIKSNITSTGKCLNPVTTKCVVWDGPDITCLDGTTLCKGQNVETTLYTLATKLCEIYTALSLEDINTCINNINDGTSVSIGPTSSIKEVFSAIIKKLCTLDGRVQTLEDTPCLEQVAIVPECLRIQATSYPSYNPVTFTLPLQYYAELVANSVCALLINITELQNAASNINQQIADLWTALEGCSSTSQNYVLPTCTYNWSVSPDGDPVTVQTAFSWLEADYCTLRGLLGSNTALTDAVNSQCANLGAENTLAPGLGGTLSNLPSWVDNPTNISDAVTNMWLTVCDMRSYISDVLSLCCKSICDYLQVGFVATWTPNGDKVQISFITSINPIVYEDGTVPPASNSPFKANGTPFTAPGGPAWINTQFPTLTQTDVQFILDDGNGNSFTLNTGKTINEWAQTVLSGQYLIDFTAGTVPANYDQTSLNQTINISFTYDVIINGTTKTCTFDSTLGLPYECVAPKPYNCNGEIVVLSNTGTDMQVKVTALEYETDLLKSGTATGPGSGTDTLLDSTYSFAGQVGYIVTVTTPGPNPGEFIVQCRYIDSIVPLSSNHEIKLDSPWTTPILAGDTYEIKNFCCLFAPAPPWTTPGVPSPVSNYITNALTGFDVYVVLSNSTFDINDENTWQIMAQANNVSPIIMCQGTGYIWGDETFAANTEYIVVVQALYKCGKSQYVSTTTYNQIAASVSIQVGTPPNLLFGVFDAATTYVLAENVISDNTALVDKYAQIGIPARYALDLPAVGNVTEIGITPLPAFWAVALPGGQNNISKCGMCLPYTGTQTVSGQTVPNHDFVIGLYTGYSVEIFQLDQFGTAYIPLLDNNFVAYKTDSIADPTLKFLSNTPQAPNIIYSVPATYPYSRLPFVVRYDPNQYKVNQSPDYHTIYFDSFAATFIADPTNLFGVLWDTFDMHLTVKILRWDSATNTYIQYPTPRYMDATITFTGGFTNSGATDTFSQNTTTITFNSMSAQGYTNSIAATYGDAFIVEAWTPAPTKMYDGCGCYNIPNDGCSYRSSAFAIDVSVHDLATTACNPTSCNISGTPGNGGFVLRDLPVAFGIFSGCLPDCLGSYSSTARKIVGFKTGIITEDYDVQGALTLRVGPSAQGSLW